MFFTLAPVIAVLRGHGNTLSTEEISALLGSSITLPSEEIAKLTPSSTFFLSCVPATEEEQESVMADGFLELVEKTADGNKVLLRCPNLSAISYCTGDRGYRKVPIDGTPAGDLKVYTTWPDA